MDCQLLSAAMNVFCRTHTAAIDAAGESHRSSLQQCKRNHNCDRPPNNHQVDTKPSLSNVQPSLDR
ncbi:MAG: hypothetical protein DMG96_05165, partial [Acidobacteria bacterium]